MLRIPVQRLLSAGLSRHLLARSGPACFGNRSAPLLASRASKAKKNVECTDFGGEPTSSVVADFKMMKFGAGKRLKDTADVVPPTFIDYFTSRGVKLETVAKFGIFPIILESGVCAIAFPYHAFPSALLNATAKDFGTSLSFLRVVNAEDAFEVPLVIYPNGRYYRDTEVPAGVLGLDVITREAKKESAAAGTTMPLVDVQQTHSYTSKCAAVRAQIENAYSAAPKTFTNVVVLDNEIDCLLAYQALSDLSDLPPSVVSVPPEILTRRFSVRGVDEGFRFPPEIAKTLRKFHNVTILRHDSADQLVMNSSDLAVEIGLERCRVAPPFDGPVTDFIAKFKSIEDFTANCQNVMSTLISPASTIDVADLFVNYQAHRGVAPTALKMPKFWELVKGIRGGELTVFTGSTGVGKTTFLSQLSLALTLPEASGGANSCVLWFSFEVKREYLLRKMYIQMAGLTDAPAVPIELDRKTPYTEKELAALRKWLHGRTALMNSLPIILSTNHGSCEPQNVIKTLTAKMLSPERKLIPSVIIIDNLNFMLSGVGSDAARFTIQDQAYSLFRKFASDFNVHLVLVMHPRKEQRGPITLDSVWGGAKAVQEADNVIILQRKNAYNMTPFGVPTSNELIDDNVKVLQVGKNRYDGATGKVELVEQENLLCFREAPPMPSGSKIGGSFTIKDAPNYMIQEFGE